MVWLLAVNVIVIIFALILFYNFKSETEYRIEGLEISSEYYRKMVKILDKRIDTEAKLSMDIYQQKEIGEKNVR
jgi:hypothetical protein